MKKTNLLFIILAIVLIVVSIGMWYFAPHIFSNYDYPFYGHMIGGWMMPFGMIAMVIFWAFVIVVALKALQNHDGTKYDISIEQLKKRLAQGDITIEEYEKLLSKIKED